MFTLVYSDFLFFYSWHLRCCSDSFICRFLLLLLHQVMLLSFKVDLISYFYYARMANR